MRCKTKKSDGKQCRARALNGKEYCALHDDPNRAAELTRKGVRDRVRDIAWLQENNMDPLSGKLKTLHKDVGNQIEEEYYFKTLALVQEIGSPDLLDGSVPFEVWMGVAQAMADASGLQVVLQQGVMQEVKGLPDQFRIVRYRGVGKASPTLFWATAPRAVVFSATKGRPPE